MTERIKSEALLRALIDAPPMSPPPYLTKYQQLCLLRVLREAQAIQRSKLGTVALAEALAPFEELP